MSSKHKTLNFRRASFQLFKELMDGTTWENFLRDKKSRKKWQLLKALFLGAQELSVSMCWKSGREGRRPAWLRKDLLIKLKIEMHRQWKQEHIHWE